MPGSRVPTTPRAPVFPAREAAAAALLAAAAGIAVVKFPLPAVLAVAVLVAACVASRLAVPLFAAALLTLAYDPLSVGIAVLSRPELQKGIVYFALVPLLISRGVSARLFIVLPAYAVAALLTAVSGHTVAGLGPAQTASTFITLTAGWLALSIRWRWQRDWPLLALVTVVPLVCLFLGGVLDVATGRPVLVPATSADPVARLQGASIAAILGLMAFIACVTCVVLWRANGWRWARPLFVVNVLILAGTVSRGAAVALGIAMIWPALQYVRGRTAGSPGAAVARVVFAVMILGLIAAIAVPRLERRNSGSTVYGSQVVQSDSTSGRDDAWAEYYAIAKQSPIFGHGIGSSPLIKIDEPGFEVQHNEYLRLYLEAGYLGGLLILFAIIAVVAQAIARAPRWLRGELIGTALAIAAYSYTDNTLTTMALVVPFCLLLGICASAGDGVLGSRPRGAPRSGRVSPTPSASLA